jgi:hypothetical protein
MRTCPNGQPRRQRLRWRPHSQKPLEGAASLSNNILSERYFDWDLSVIPRILSRTSDNFPFPRWTFWTDLGQFFWFQSARLSHYSHWSNFVPPSLHRFSLQQGFTLLSGFGGSMPCRQVAMDESTIVLVNVALKLSHWYDVLQCWAAFLVLISRILQVSNAWRSDLNLLP